MAPSLAEYRRKVACYTRSTASSTASDGPERVVIVPPGASLEAGFERARARLEGRPVRLVAHGASLEANWPTWARRDPGLRVTELGAYRLLTHAEANASLHEAMATWLGELFAGVFPAGEAVFAVTCQTRFFFTRLQERALVEGLAACHRADDVECVDTSWSGWEIFGQLVGKPAPRSRWDEMTWAPVFTAAAVATLGATIAQVGRQYVSSAASRARLARERARRSGPPPMLWAAVIPDLERVNRHVLVSVVEPAIREGRRVGLLLIGSLDRGVRSETDLRTRTSETLWGGLGGLPADPLVSEIDQLAGPEDLVSLATAVAEASLRSARVVWRLATRPPYVMESGIAHPLRPRAADLAKLATTDVARAVMGDHAARRAIERRSFQGSTVFFVGCTFPAAAASNRVLQAAGATTVEFSHGAGDDNPSDSGTSIQCVWTEADAAAFEAVGARAIAAGMPRRMIHRTKRRPARNVLLMTNYCHRDACSAGVWPYEPFQRELLRVSALLRERVPELVFRWRPHPSDAPSVIERGHREFPDLTLSLGTKLDDDLSWADLVVTSTSTTVFESLFAEVPVFVHVLPALENAPTLASLSPARRFFYATDVVDRIVGCLARLDADDPDLLAPEVASRAALFGPSLEPTSIAARFLDPLPPPRPDGAEPRSSGA